jgi:hypothetical protein
MKAIPNDWHLNKTVSIGNLLTLGTLIVAALIGFLQVQGLAEDNKEAISSHKEADMHKGAAATVSSLQITGARVDERLSRLEEDMRDMREDQKRGFESIMRELRKRPQPAPRPNYENLP